MESQPHFRRCFSPLIPGRWLSLAAVIGVLAFPADAAPAGDARVVGVYKLISVNDAEVPATVRHGQAELQVQAGTFTINADGTCASSIRFGRAGGPTGERVVTATYTREGSRLVMKWRGAGTTTGRVEGDEFKMNNEGMVFAYRRQQPEPAGREVLDHLIGSWHTEYTRSDGANNGAPTSGAADFTCSRILDGRFVRDEGTHADGTSQLALYMYDEIRARYRAWWFSSTGDTAEASGQWDPEAKTLTWTSIQPSDTGLRISTQYKFESATAFNWTMEVMKPDGEALSRTTGKATRSEQAD